MAKITDYTEVFDLQTNDYFDLSEDTNNDGTLYTSKKLNQSTLRTELGVDGTNGFVPIYTHAAPNDRLIESIMFQDTAANFNRIGLNTVTPTAEFNWVFAAPSAGDKVKFESNTGRVLYMVSDSYSTLISPNNSVYTDTNTGATWPDADLKIVVASTTDHVIVGDSGAFSGWITGNDALGVHLNFRHGITANRNEILYSTGHTFAIGQQGSPADEFLISAGNIGINQDTPTSLLHLKGTNNAINTIGVNFTRNNGQSIFRTDNAGGIRLGVDAVDNNAQLAFKDNAAYGNSMTMHDASNNKFFRIQRFGWLRLGEDTDTGAMLIDSSSGTNTFGASLQILTDDDITDIIFIRKGIGGDRLKLLAGGDLFTYAGVGINTAGALNASAQLQIDSTTGGILIPRMTSTQASAITGVDGLMLYTTDTNGTFTSVGFWGYENGAWVKL